MVGRRGPLPRRLDEPQEASSLRRKRAEGVRGTRVSAPVPSTVGREADPQWHPIARMIWDAALKSPQRRFYEETDWAVLYSVCDDVSYFKGQERRSGQMLASVNSMLLSLLLTEGDRRRTQIELTRDDEGSGESPSLTVLKEWAERKKAEGASGS